MSKNIIKPLMFITDEEKKQLMIEVEKEKSAIRLSHMATNHFDPAYIIRTPRIENNYNPFIHACKSVYGFIKDNVKINVGINKNLIDANNSIIGIVPSEPKTLKNLIPKVSAKITAGPFEVNVDSDMLTGSMKDKMITF